MKNEKTKTRKKFINHCLKLNTNESASFDLSFAPDRRIEPVSCFMHARKSFVHSICIQPTSEQRRGSGTEQRTQKITCVVQCANLLYFVGIRAHTHANAAIAKPKSWLHANNKQRTALCVCFRARARTCANTNLCAQERCHISRKKYVLTFILIFITSNWGLCAIN